jgi:hypothetical protein
MKYILIGITLIFTTGITAKESYKCYPYCQKYSLEKLKNLDLASQLPPRPDLYRYRVKGVYRGDTFFKDQVPVYSKTSSGAYKHSGFVKLGLEVTLDKLASIQSRMFYRVTIGKDQSGNSINGYLDGRFIEGFAYNENVTLDF